MSEYFFTSESVSEGHPDKLADQVSDRSHFGRDKPEFTWEATNKAAALKASI